MKNYLVSKPVILATALTLSASQVVYAQDDAALDEPSAAEGDVAVDVVLDETSEASETLSPSDFPENTTLRGYGKRDRLSIGSISAISPAQLHESKGPRVKVGVETRTKTFRSEKLDSDLTLPSYTADLTYGWDNLTLGLGVNATNGKNDGDNGLEEQYDSMKLLPQVAYTMAKNYTVALGVESSQLGLKEDLDSGSRRSFQWQTNRGIVGASFHTESLEFGVVYASEVNAEDTDVGSLGTTLSLSSTLSSESRSVYQPATTTVYSRGNVTPNVEVLSALSLARYDGNVEGAVALFEDYTHEDRLAGKLVGTYWTNSRSKVSLAAEYLGAASAPALGSEDVGLGYRVVNLYGATLEGTYSFNRKTYLGLMASHKEGTRKVDAPFAVGSEQELEEVDNRFAGFVSVKL